MEGTRILAADLGRAGAMAILRRGSDGTTKATAWCEWDWKKQDEAEVYARFARLVQGYVPKVDIVSYEHVPRAPVNSTIPGFRAIIMGASHSHGRMCYGVNVSTVKKDLTGHGRSGKDVVEAVVRERLGVSGDVGSDNLFDALSVGLWAADHMTVYPSGGSGE